MIIKICGITIIADYCLKSITINRLRVCGDGVIMFINVWRYVVVHVSYCARVPSVEDGGGAGAC